MELYSNRRLNFDKLRQLIQKTLRRNWRFLYDDLVHWDLHLFIRDYNETPQELGAKSDFVDQLETSKLPKPIRQPEGV